MTTTRARARARAAGSHRALSRAPYHATPLSLAARTCARARARACACRRQRTISRTARRSRRRTASPNRKRVQTDGSARRRRRAWMRGGDSKKKTSKDKADKGPEEARRAARDRPEAVRAARRPRRAPGDDADAPVGEPGGRRRRQVRHGRGCGTPRASATGFKLRGRDAALCGRRFPRRRAARAHLQPLYARPPPVWAHPTFVAEFGDAFSLSQLVFIVNRGTVGLDEPRGRQPRARGAPADLGACTPGQPVGRRPRGAVRERLLPSRWARVPAGARGGDDGRRDARRLSRRACAARRVEAPCTPASSRVGQERRRRPASARRSSCRWRSRASRAAIERERRLYEVVLHVQGRWRRGRQERSSRRRARRRGKAACATSRGRGSTTRPSGSSPSTRPRPPRRQGQGDRARSPPLAPAALSRLPARCARIGRRRRRAARAVIEHRALPHRRGRSATCCAGAARRSTPCDRIAAGCACACCSWRSTTCASSRRPRFAGSAPCCASRRRRRRQVARDLWPTPATSTARASPTCWRASPAIDRRLAALPLGAAVAAPELGNIAADAFRPPVTSAVPPVARVALRRQGAARARRGFDRLHRQGGGRRGAARGGQDGCRTVPASRCSMASATSSRSCRTAWTGRLAGADPIEPGLALPTPRWPRSTSRRAGARRAARTTPALAQVGVRGARRGSSSSRSCSSASPLGARRRGRVLREPPWLALAFDASIEAAALCASSTSRGSRSSCCSTPRRSTSSRTTACGCSRATRRASRGTAPRRPRCRTTTRSPTACSARARSTSARP